MKFYRSRSSRMATLGKVAVAALVSTAGLSVIGLAHAGANPPGPSVIALSPGSGPNTGGTNVIVFGTGFGTSGNPNVTSVQFGTVSASFSMNHATLTAVAPPALAGETQTDVTVTTVNGITPLSPVDVFTYTYPAPAVTGVSPSSDLPTGGATVAVTGTKLTGASAVHFGSTSASFTVNSDSSITATVPRPASLPPLSATLRQPCRGRPRRVTVRLRSPAMWSPH
jgi:hypothetical protein